MTEIDNPPEELIAYVGGGDFRKVGENHMNAFLSEGNLKPNANFLDVGCGSGRIAVPLTGYLKDGLYEGFDVDKESIQWCKKNIESKHKNFHFTLVNLQNTHYNKDGEEKSSEFLFPYANETFDFVCLTSVFTHLKTPDFINYLSQISRVLKEGGKCYATYFLLNNYSLARIDEGKSKMTFQIKFDGFRANNEEDPEAALAYDEDFIRESYSKNSLRILEPISYGSWSGLDNHVFLQDRILAEKRRA